MMLPKIPKISPDQRNTLFVFGWGLHLLFSLAYLLSSFFVVKNANAGFNALFTGIIFIVYGLGGLKLTRPNETNSPFTIGFLLGANVMVIVLALVTSIHWGELSGCKEEQDNTSVDIKQFSCKETSAMKSVSAFSALVFILAILTGAALFHFKDDLTASTGSECLAKEKYMASDFETPEDYDPTKMYSSSLSGEQHGQQAEGVLPMYSSSLSEQPQEFVPGKMNPMHAHRASEQHVDATMHSVQLDGEMNPMHAHRASEQHVDATMHSVQLDGEMNPMHAHRASGEQHVDATMHSVQLDGEMNPMHAHRASEQHVDVTMHSVQLDDDSDPSN